ncbi:MAG: sigma-70 family RNA polymerase sigma factor [Cyanobacteria bacterium J06627_8]
MDVDEQLKRLAIEAQSAPPKSVQRQRSLTCLVSLICQSKRLVRPYRGQFQGFYQDIYAEAQQRLFLHLCENIDRYDPQREVLQWVNFLMQKRFFVEASRDVMPTAPKGMDRSQVKRITLDVLNKQNPVDWHSSQTPSLSEEMMQCITEDCNGVFQSTHILDKPDANFQRIALSFLAGYSWKEISSDLDVKVVTLSSFYQRCLLKFAPLFKDYLST